VPRSAENLVVPVRWRIGYEPRVLYPTNELADRNLSLQPSERATETEVDAATVAKVFIVLAFEVNLIWVREPARIAVSRPVHHDDWRAFWNCRSRNLNVYEGSAGGWDIEFPTSTQLLVASKLADYANDEGDSIFPSKPTIARKAQCSERNVFKVIAAFVACGLLEVIREGGGRGNTTEYGLNLALIEELRNGTARLEGDHATLKVVRGENKPCKNCTVSETLSPTTQNPVVDGTKTLSLATGDSSKTHQEPSRARTREDLSNSNLDDRKRRPAVRHRYVSGGALDKVRAIAPGWDRQALLAKFLAWTGAKTAENMDAAFLGWAKKFTRGKPPK
jgi:hypothetical protein